LVHWPLQYALDESVDPEAPRPVVHNLVERELRSLVIAGEMSFGSQSDAGAKTREILTAVLDTLKKRTPDVTSAFKSALDRLAEQSGIDADKAIFSFDSS